MIFHCWRKYSELWSNVQMECGVFSPECHVHCRSLSRDLFRFLWVRLQVIHLQEQSTDYDIRNALKSLSSGLQPTFTRILKAIDRLPAPRRSRVQRLLRWVVCAEHLLSLREISEAVVIHDMQGEWDDSRCINQPASLIEDCFNLVLCTESSLQSPSDAKVQLIHASVKEFLLQNPVLLDSLADYHIFPFPNAQVTIVKDCLKYLRLMAEDVQWETKVWGMNSEHKFLYSEDLAPFVAYASECWPQHLRASGPAGEQLVSAFCDFMQSKSRSRQFWSLCYNRKRYASPVPCLSDVISFCMVATTASMRRCLYAT
jgi:hypothetical protein